MLSARGIGLRAFLLAGALLLVSGTASNAASIPLTAILTGAQETPPNASIGIGAAAFILDDVNRILLSSVTFRDLTGPTTSADIEDKAGLVVHLFPNSPPALTGFPVGVTQGSFTDIWTGLTATNVAALEAGNYYINIHTSAFPGGEVRGLMTVPESSSLTLGAVGAAIVGGAWLLRWARA